MIDLLPTLICCKRSYWFIWYSCELLLQRILCCSFFLNKDSIGKVRESILFHQCLIFTATIKEFLNSLQIQVYVVQYWTTVIYKRSQIDSGNNNC